MSSATVFLKKKDSPKSPLEHAADPDRELGEDRPVEAEAVADQGDLLGVGVVAGDDRRRVAGGEPQHQEDEHRHDQHHRDGRERGGAGCRAASLSPRALAGGRSPERPPRTALPGPIGRAPAQRPVFSMFQNAGAGVASIPVTFLRSTVG